MTHCRVLAHCEFNSIFSVPLPINSESFTLIGELFFSILPANKQSYKHCNTLRWPKTLPCHSEAKNNPLMGNGNYSATSNNMKLAQWPLMGGLLHLVQWGGDLAGPPMPLLVLPNVTAHPSTASVPITVLLYNGLLLCGFNVAIQRLK